MKSLIASFILVAAAALTGLAHAAPNDLRTTTPVDAAALAAFLGEVPQDFLGTPSLTSTEEEAIAWRCDASSYYYGGDFFWISYNLAWSRYKALANCNSWYGGGCVFQCATVWL